MTPKTGRQLSPEARAILLYIVEQLDSSQDKASFFLTYKQVHTALGLTQRGDTLGRSLDVQGLGELADWAYANSLPAVTGLIITQETREPGAKFYSQNKRKPNDLKFWLDQAKLSREFNWKPYLGPASTASATAAAPDRAEPRPNQTPRPMVGSEPPLQQTSQTYLMVWNPESYKWTSIKSELGEFYQSLSLVRRWGVGNQKSIRPGDRIFLVKVGSKGTRGIMGSGYSTSFAYEGEHWDGSDKKTNYIEVAFDVLIDPYTDAASMIPLEKLTSDPALAKQEWSPPRSGISISAPVAAHLEALWRSRLDYLNRKALLASGGDQKAYYEGKAYEIVSKRYERDPEARRQCLHARGYRCLVCSFDFKEAYGELGEGFIHVHHLTPIHSRQAEYQIHPERDLAPVCPNCHAMLHRRNPPLAIEELQRILGDKKTNGLA